MSEKAQTAVKATKTTTAAKETTTAKAATNGVVKSEKQATKATGPKWTLERCQKYARRFSNEAQWAAGSPASYKSAVAHGWREQCLQVTGKVLTGNFRPKTTAKPLKKAA